MTQATPLAKRIVKGTITVMFFTFIASLLSYILRVFYSRTLTIEMYGLFFAFLNLATGIALYSDLGFGYSLSYLIPKLIKEGQHSKSWDLYKYGQLLGTISTLVISISLIIAAPWIAKEYFKIPESQNLIYIFCIYLIVNNFVTTMHALFVGLQQEKYYSSIQVIRMLLTLSISMLTLIFIKPNLVVYAIITVFSYIICAFIYDFILHKNNQTFKYFSFNWDRELFKQMYTYALPTLFASSIYSLVISSDTFFLTLFKGIREVGIYNVVLPLASIPVIVLSPVASFILPMVSRYMVKEPKKVSYLLDSILTIVPFISLYFALFLFLFPSPPIVLIFGEKWSGLADVPLSILALGYIGASLSIFFTTIIMGMGKIRERLTALVIIAVCSIFINAFLIFYFGVIGAAIAMSIIYLLSIIIIGQVIKKEVNFSYPFVYYFKLFLFALLLSLPVKFINLQPHGWIAFILTGLGYTLIMILFATYLKIINKSLMRLFFKSLHE